MISNILDLVGRICISSIFLLSGINKIQNYFDNIISIESVGIYKPDSKVYEMPIKKYDCKPENICVMSSNTWEIGRAHV